MKIKNAVLAGVAMLGLLASGAAQSELMVRGVDTLGNRLIYDSDLNVTWYDYTRSSDTWQNQVSWAAGLSITYDANVFDDWRLPTTVDGPFARGFDGTSTAGYNITSSEMGHLYYSELGAFGYQRTDGSSPNGWGLVAVPGWSNTYFTQLKTNNSYWSGTVYSLRANEGAAWGFSNYNGSQSVYFGSDGDVLYGLAVRNGDVASPTAPIPEPETYAMMLAGLGLLGLMGRRRKQNAESLRG